MLFFKKFFAEANDAITKFAGLYQKIEEEDARQDLLSEGNIEKNDMLRSSLKFSTYAPLIIQSYILLYGLYSCYTIIKVMVLAPIEFMVGLSNFFLKSLKLYRVNYITIHSFVVLFVAYIFTLNEDMFDISYMYHLIRGQSTVKVYAIVFAIESSQVVMTKLGIFVYQNIKQKLTSKQIPFYRLLPEFFVQSCYVFLHAYIIYMDFLIYIVVLNSSLESFIIFWSVVYLTKMKGAPSFGIGIDKYKLTLTEDSKYRFTRIIYLMLFLANQIWISIPSLGFKFLFILIIEELFIIGKHLMYLLSSYKGASDTSALQIREDMYKTMYLNPQLTSVDRCVLQNFTVLPFSVFSIKIICIIIESNWEPNFLAYLTFYVLLCVLVGLLIVLIISIKSIEEFAHEIRKKNKEDTSPLINSICIDVIGRLVEASKEHHNSDPLLELLKMKGSQISPMKGDTKSQKQSQKSIQSSIKLKKATSIFESILIHANSIEEPQQQSDKGLIQDPLGPFLEQKEDEFLIQSNSSSKGNGQLRKTKSHM